MPLISALNRYNCTCASRQKNAELSGVLGRRSEALEFSYVIVVKVDTATVAVVVALRP